MNDDERQAERDREYESNKAQAEAQLDGLARLGALISHQRDTEFPDNLDRRIEERRLMEEENFLCVEHDRVMRFVLCTGGPHAEIVWEEGRDPFVQCYGWWGSNKFSRGLTEEEQAGFDQVFPDDFDELWQMTYRD